MRKKGIFVANKQIELALLVTTAKGVFFGYVDERPTTKTREIWLKRARCCVFWGSNVKGFLGLASHGPNSSCRIGPPVDELLINEITSIAIVSASAAKAWEVAPWR